MDKLYVRKDECWDIQNCENHSGVDGDLASHKSKAICWRYQKAKGITKKGSTVLVLPFFYIFWKTIMYSPVVLLSEFAPNPFPFDSTKISFVF